MARNMPNGERATRNRDGEHGKTMVPLSGSSKNDAQLLCQNIKQNVLRHAREGQRGGHQSKRHATKGGDFLCPAVDGDK